MLYTSKITIRFSSLFAFIIAALSDYSMFSKQKMIRVSSHALTEVFLSQRGGKPFFV